MAIATAPQWFDSHVHLERYSPVEEAAIRSRARAVGVTALLAVSTSLASSRRTVALPPEVWRAVGVHPTRAGSLTAEVLSELDALAGRPGVVAIGETGFDAAGPPPAEQRRAFAAQCDIARHRGLTLILHIDGSGAWDELVASAEALTGLRVIRHYFQGGAAEGTWHRERGHYLSFGRPLLRVPVLQRLARDYPADLLLIETDTYPLTGRTTEPRDLVAVGEGLAALRGWTIAECAAQLWTNSRTALALPG